MSRSLLMAAASLALLLPAAASAAPGDTHVRAESGALAGRSPHQAYRPVVATPANCGKTMHSIPAGKLPSYSLVVPDQCNDMHDCSVATGDRWLKGFLPPLLASRRLRGHPRCDR